MKVMKAIGITIYLPPKRSLEYQRAGSWKIYIASLIEVFKSCGSAKWNHKQTNSAKGNKIDLKPRVMSGEEVLQEIKSKENKKHKHKTSNTGFDLTTHDSYFMVLVEIFMNHILAETTYSMNRIEWTEQWNGLIKSANKYQIIGQCHNTKNILINDFQHHPFLYRAKVL